MAYRSSVHDTISTSPAKVIFGNDLRLPADLRFGCFQEERNNNHNNFVFEMEEKLHEIHENVRDKIQLKSDKMKARYDLKENIEGFSEGQLVLLYNPQRRKGLSPKLQSSWEGPYKIIKKINDLVYRIQWNASASRKMKVVHLDRLSPYKSRVDEVARDGQH